MYVGLYVKYHYSCQILLKFEFSRQIFEKFSVIKFYQISLVWAEFHADIQKDRETDRHKDRQTDRHNEANTCFSQFYDTRLQAEPTRQKFCAVWHSPLLFFFSF